MATRGLAGAFTGDGKWAWRPLAWRGIVATVLALAVGRSAFALDTANDRCTNGTITATGTSPAGEEKEKAFDDNTSTKWLVQAPSGSVTYQFGGGCRWVVTNYTLTSGGDAPPRDPRNWTLEGSDDGATWTVVDTRTGSGPWAARNTTYSFACPGNTAAYNRYRLNVATNNGLDQWSGNLLQLSELELFGGPSSEVTITSPVAGAEFYRGTELAVSAVFPGAATGVAFYANGDWVGGDAIAPYGIAWSCGSTGTYALTAVACDGAGLAVTSAPVTVSVVAPPAWKMGIRFAGYNKDEPLTNFPALVILGTNLTGFSYDQFLSATNEDLRFWSADANQPLDYEIESWNTGGSSYVWVRLPVLASSNDCLWAYWGKSGQTARASTTNGAVWSGGYATVWHLDGLADASGNGNAGIDNNGSGAAAGRVGFGRGFDGVDDYLTAAIPAALGGSNSFTISFWMKFVHRTERQWLIDYGQQNTGEMHFLLSNADGGQFGVWGSALQNGPLFSSWIDTWTHCATTYRQNGNTLKTYINGVEVATTSSGDAPNVTVGGGLRVGKAQSWGGEAYYQGRLDEFRLAGTARSSNWVWAAYRTMADNGVFSAYGEAQATGAPITWTSPGVSNVVVDAATAYATLGGTNADVVLLWDTTDRGATPGGWAGTNAVGAGLAPGRIDNANTVIAGLQPGQRYVCRFHATNATLGVEAFSVAIEFTTKSAPTASNGAGATNLSAGVSQLRGTLVTDGGAASTVVLYWGPADGGTNAADWANAVTSAPAGPGPVTITVSNLYYGQRYYYRTFATNAYGGAWAADSTSFLSLRPAGAAVLPVTSGLALRLDADQLTGLSDGAQVNTWTDVSGLGNHAVRQSGSSAGYPQYKTGILNGKPVVRFNSASINTGDYLKFTRISTIRSVFWVLKETGGLSAGHFLLGDDSTYDFHRQSANGPLWEGTYAHANIRGGTTRTNGVAVNGTTTSLPANQHLVVSLVTSGNVQANQVTQDRTFWGSWQGDIAEILIYTTALTSDQEAQVGGYLAYKYGFSTAYPAYTLPGAIFSLTNSPVTDLTTASAVMNATLTATDTVFDVTAYWGPANGGTNVAAWSNAVPVGQVTNAAGLALSAVATGLAGGVTYSFAFRGVNAAGDLWATNVLTFRAASPPAVDAAAGATNLVAGAARLRGTLTSDGGSPTTVTVFWGTDTNAWTGSSVVGVTPVGAFSTVVSNLCYGLTYRYQCHATNALGASWSAPSDGFVTLNPSAMSPYLPGLRAGYLSSAWDTATANPMTTNTPGPHAARYGANNLPNPWADNRTWVYTGQIYFNGGSYCFAENVDDNTLLKIDGTNYINDSTWNNVALSGVLALSPGWHDLEMRFGNGSGGAGAAGQSGWSATANPYGFGYNTNGVNTGAAASYTYPEDNGTMSLFRYANTNAVSRAGAQPAAAAATDVTLSTATLNGTLQASGAVGRVWVFWGPTDGGSNAEAWARSACVGSYTNVALTNLAHAVNGLAGTTPYYFTFRASNDAETAWAPASAGFVTAVNPAAFQYKAKFTLGGYGREETLTQFPALVMLGTNVAGFSYAGFANPGQYGDLRFLSGDLTQELPYEVEQWNPAGTSLVWVRVPELAGTNTAVWAFWGNAAAGVRPYTTNGAVWTNGYLGVWHFAATNSTPNLRDSSPAANHGTNAAGGAATTVTSGPLGGGESFAGASSQYIALPGGNRLLPADTNISVSVWAKPASIAGTTGGGRYLNIGRDTASSALIIGFESTSKAFLQRLTSAGAGTAVDSAGSVVTGRWAHFAWSYGPSAGATLCINGLRDTAGAATAGAAAGSTNAAKIGGNVGSTGNYYDGALDELRVSSVVRSTNWAWAEYLSMASNAVFSSNAGVETVAEGVPSVENRAPTAVQATTVTFNGLLTSTGASETAVSVYWGESDAGTNGWSFTNTWAAPVAGGLLSTSVTVTADRTYYYRFGAANAAGPAWASGSQSFGTAPITLGVAAHASEVGLTPGTFTVNRASSSTGTAVTVSYAVTGGTASNGVDYATPGGSVTIPAGSATAAIVIAPRFGRPIEGSETITITLQAGELYPLGTPASATMDLADDPGAVAGGLDLVWDNAAGNWLWDTSSLNWHRASDPYGTAFFVPGDRVTFGVGDRSGGTVSLAGQTANVERVAFNWALGDSGFTIGNGTVRLGAGGLQHNADWVSETVTATLLLATNLTIQHMGNRQLNLNGTVETAGNRLTLDYNGQGFYVNGRIRGAGSVLAQNGTFYFRATNDFAGELLVNGSNGGKVVADQANGVISGSTTVTLYNAGTLELGDNASSKADDGVSTSGRLANTARVSLLSLASRLKLVGQSNVATTEKIGDLRLDGDVGVVEVGRNGTGSATLDAAQLVRHATRRPVALVYGSGYLLGSSEKVTLRDGGASLTQVGGDGSRTTNRKLVPYLFTRTEATLASGYSRVGGASDFVYYDGANGLRSFHRSNDYVNATGTNFPAVNADGNDNVRLPYTAVQPSNAASVVTLDGETTVNALLCYNDKAAAHDKEFRLDGTRLTVKSGLILGGASATGARLQPLRLNVSTTDFASAEGVIVGMGPHYGSIQLSGSLAGQNGVTLYVDSPGSEGLFTLSGNNSALHGQVTVFDNLVYAQHLNALGDGGNTLFLGNGTVRANATVSGGRAIAVATLAGNGTVSSTSDSQTFNIGGGGAGGLAQRFLLLAGGLLAPGDAEQAGTLTLSPSDATTLRWEGGTVAVDLFGTNTADAVRVTDSATTPALTISNACQLAVTVHGSPRVGDTFLVVNVLGGTAISGQFAQGTALTNVLTSVGEADFAILYNSALGGGSGNDIVLQCTATRVLAQFTTPATIVAEAATNLSTTAAWLNGSLTATGDSITAVAVYWGPEDGGTNLDGWAASHVWAAPQATNRFTWLADALTGGATYHFRYAASNLAGWAWAPTPGRFQTGALTVEATDPLARKTGETGSFTISRPATATGLAVTVSYAVSGTAAGGVDYAALSGVATLTTGVASVLLTVTPLADSLPAEGDETVIVTLLPCDAAPLGTPDSATVTIRDDQAVSTWSKRIRIPFTGYTRPETLTNFPALVVLGPHISGFSYGDFLSGASDDLRFTDGGGTQFLNHEIERWDTESNSYVWVQVPALTNGTHIWAYVGKTGQPAPASLTNGATWSAGYRNVWHLDAASGTLPDATTNGNTGLPQGGVTQGAGSRIARGLQLDGTDDFLATSQSAVGPGVFKLSTWFKTTTASGGKLLGYGNSQTGSSSSYDRQIYLSNGGQLYAGVYNGAIQTLNTPGALNDGQWHHAALTLSGAGLGLYVDGAFVGSSAATNGEAYAGYWRIGYDNLGSWPAAPASYRFLGAMDEVRVEHAARSADWIWAEWLNVASNSLFSPYEPAEALNASQALALTLPASGVTAAGATLNGSVLSTGASPAAVWVFWDQVDRGETNGGWAGSYAWAAPQGTGDYAYAAGLAQDRAHFYRYAVSNDAGWVYGGVQGFITAPVTIGTTADASEIGLTPGTFTVSRASSAVGIAVTVGYAVTGGTASNGVDYVSLSGAVTIPAGASSAAIIVTPKFGRLVEGLETVEVTLQGGASYPLGTPASATMDLADDPAAVLGGIDLVWDNAAGNWLWDTASLNWHRAAEPYGSSFFAGGDRVTFGVGDRNGGTVSLASQTVSVERVGFSWAQGDTGFTIGSGTLRVGSGGIVHNADWVSETISAAIVLATNATIQHNANRQLYVNGAIDTAGNRLTLDYSGQGFYLNGPIRGTGSVLAQNGTFYLRATNDFSGSFLVSGGNGGRAVLDQANGVIGASTNLVLYNAGTLELGDSGSGKADDGIGTFGRLANTARVSLLSLGARLKLVGQNNGTTTERIGDLRLDGDVGVVEVGRNGSGTATLDAAQLLRHPVRRPVALVYGSGYLLGSSEKVTLRDGGASLTQIGGDGSRTTNRKLVPYLFTRTEATLASGYSRVGGASGFVYYDPANGLTQFHRSNDYVNATAVAFPAVNADGDDNVRLPFTAVQPSNAASVVTLDGETTVNALLFYNDKAAAHDKEFRLDGTRLTVKSGLILGGASATGARLQPLTLNVSTTDFASAEGVIVGMGPHYGSFQFSGSLAGTDGATFYVDSPGSEGQFTLSGDNRDLHGQITVFDNTVYAQHLNALGDGGNTLFLGNGTVRANATVSGGRAIAVATLAGNGTVSSTSDTQPFNIGGGGAGGLAQRFQLLAGGTLAPGDAEQAGTITLSTSDASSHRWEGGTVAVDLFGTNAADAVRVTDSGGTPTLTIGNACQLAVSLTRVPGVGEAYLVVNVSGGTAIDGAFAQGNEALARLGDRVVVFEVLYNSSLAGGDGNDVVLRVVRVSGPPGVVFTFR